MKKNKSEISKLRAYFKNSSLEEIWSDIEVYAPGEDTTAPESMKGLYYVGTPTQAAIAYFTTKQEAEQYKINLVARIDDI